MSSIIENPSSSSGSKLNPAPKAEKAYEDRLFSVLKDSSPDILKAQRDISAALRTMLSQEERESEPNLARLRLIRTSQELVTALPDLPNRDYRLLIGELTVLRRDHGARSIDQALKTLKAEGCSEYAASVIDKLTEAFKHYRDLRFSNLPGSMRAELPHAINAELIENFATDAVILFRALCPQGVNMLSPNWSLGQNYFSDTQTLTLEGGYFDKKNNTDPDRFVVRDKVILEPTKNGEFTRLWYLSSDYLTKRQGAPQALADLEHGQSIVIGNPLKMSSILGLTDQGDTLYNIPAGARIDQRTHSRGCIRVVKLGGLYVLNSGALNEFRVLGYCGTDWRAVIFEGSAFREGSCHTFGHSRNSSIIDPKSES